MSDHKDMPSGHTSRSAEVHEQAPQPGTPPTAPNDVSAVQWTGEDVSGQLPQIKSALTAGLASIGLAIAVGLLTKHQKDILFGGMTYLIAAAILVAMIYFKIKMGRFIPRVRHRVINGRRVPIERWKNGRWEAINVDGDDLAKR